VVDIEKPDDGLTWQFQVINSQYSSANATGNALVKPIESLTMLKERAKEFCEPFKSAIEWIPDDTKYFESEITQWMPVEFDMMDGRVTLAGDAAHPMAPSMTNVSFSLLQAFRIVMNTSLSIRSIPSLTVTFFFLIHRI